MSHVSDIAVQFWQFVPCEPHEVSSVPARQFPCPSQHPWQTCWHGHRPPLPPNCVWQFPLSSQQPLGQVAGPQTNPSHVPLVHTDVAEQTSHALPPSPHALDDIPVWQLSFWSQQPGHVSWLHPVSTQKPPMHWDVGSHELQKAPPVPHSKVLFPTWHAPFWSQQPVGQVAASHTEPSHVPWKHCEPGEQIAHSPVPMPQAFAEVPG